MSTQFKISLQGFDGPLDLLLDLVKKHQIDVLKIRIITIINDFINYIKDPEVFNVKMTSEFTAMLSYLILLKSRLLLPKDEKEEEEVMSEVNDLLDIIKNYEMIKNASEDLRTSFDLQNKMHFRFSQNIEYSIENDIRTDDFDPYLLSKKIIAIMENQRKKDGIVDIAREKMNIENSVRELFEFFTNNRNCDLGILISEKKRSEATVIFFAVLIMIKKNFIKFFQQECFSPIYLESLIEDNTVLDIGNE